MFNSTLGQDCKTYVVKCKPYRFENGNSVWTDTYHIGTFSFRFCFKSSSDEFVKLIIICYEE